MRVLCLLLGVLFGAAEFCLTKAIAARAMEGKAPAAPVLLKILSYAAVMLPLFLLAPRALALRFAVGTGVGLPAAGMTIFVFHQIREKR